MKSRADAENSRRGSIMTTQVQLFINGEFVHSKSEKLIPVTNPATQEVIAQVPCATMDEMELAISSAKAAFQTWKETPVSARHAPGRRNSLALELYGSVPHEPAPPAHEVANYNSRT